MYYGCPCAIWLQQYKDYKIRVCGLWQRLISYVCCFKIWCMYIVHCTYRILVNPLKSFKKKSDCVIKKIMFKFQIYFQETCFFPEAVLRIKGAQLEALSTGLDSRSTCNIPIPVSILFIVIIVCALCSSFWSCCYLYFLLESSF